MPILINFKMQDSINLIQVLIIVDLGLYYEFKFSSAWFSIFIISFIWGSLSVFSLVKGGQYGGLDLLKTHLLREHTNFCYVQK